MRNCPNCGAAIDPYTWKCSYCGAFYWDTTAWDVEEGKPCYVKFKTPYGIITALARPIVETIEMNTETVDCYDARGNTLCMYPRSRECNINVRFHCQEDIGRKSLFIVENKNYG